VIWATFFGGLGEDHASSCAVDASGNVYLAGSTESFSGIASGGFSNGHHGGGSDAFLAKFNSAGLRQWATYYGGDSYDYGSSCAADGSGNVFLAGDTYSGQHNNMFLGAHQANFLGGEKVSS
jgi:hypothetical protein